jgi:hypothetical protein
MQRVKALEEKARTTIRRTFNSKNARRFVVLMTIHQQPKRVFRSPEAAILLELRAAQAHTIASCRPLHNIGDRRQTTKRQTRHHIAIGTILNMPYIKRHWLEHPDD